MILGNSLFNRRHHGSSGKYVYELKSEYEERCCPFFYHYTKPDHSKVRHCGLVMYVHVAIVLINLTTLR